MSQHDILKFLKENPKEWFYCIDICSYLECNHHAKISRQLMKLRKYEEVQAKKDKFCNRQRWMYKYKR